MATVLVVGGAGYIGFRMVMVLDGRGHAVVTLNHLSTVCRGAVVRGEFVRDSQAGA